MIHRDAAGRTDLRVDVVERDDVVTHEASLFPERLSLASRGDDDLNTGAVADQEYRAHVLAREGTSSAIQNARERMLARRSPQHIVHADPADTNIVSESTVDASTAPDAAADTSNDPATDRPVHEIAADAVDSITPVETPIQAATPRGFGRRTRPQATNEESPETVRESDQDIYNSVPERDPSVELPLAQSGNQQDAPKHTTFAAETADTMTVYDAVLQRAREFREATGREIPVFRDDDAAAERRARRRVQSIPGQRPPAAPPERASISAAPVAAAPYASQAAAPVASTPEIARAAVQPDRATPRPQPSVAPRSKSNPRMGISLSDLKQQTPKSHPTPAVRNDTPSQSAQMNFRRSDHQEDETLLVSRTPSFEESPVEQHRPPQASRPESHSVPSTSVDEDDYFPLEEPGPQPAVRRRAFGRLSNPWKRDRRDDETIEDRQTLASVREAIGAIEEPWDEPVAEPMPEAFVAERRPAGSVDLHHDVRDDRPVPIAASQQTAAESIPPRPSPTAPPTRQEQIPHATPVAPTRSSSLYRPVHESLLHVDERDTQPDRAPSEPMPAPRTPARRQSGNGATVLRVRADGLGDQPEQVSSWEADRWVPDIHDTSPARADASWSDEPEPYEPGLELQVVEPTPAIPATSKWSFSSAIDLDTNEGMANYRGRLFGANSASRGERRPNDDLVVDIPTHAETPTTVERAPIPVRDSPLRSANYRDNGAPNQTNTLHRTRVSDSGQMGQMLRSGSSVAPTHPHDRRTSTPGRERDLHQPDFGDGSFDLRALLEDTDGDLIPEVSIAPDVPRRCQTCRDFRPSDSGERGFCANNWAFSHRQMVNADDLPCRSSIGCWWLPSDAIWMPEEPADDTQDEWSERRQRSG